jgi:hypothetical protein
MCGGDKLGHSTLGDSVGFQATKALDEVTHRGA